MKKSLERLNRYWKDPVWSKIISAAILGSVIFVWSSIKEISFSTLINNLKSAHIQVSYLVLLIIVCFALIIIIPLLAMKIITFRLQHSGVPKTLISNEFDIVIFLSGDWLCEYKRLSTGWGGAEVAKISNGNNYALDGKLIYILTDITVDYPNRKISWTKTRYSDSVKHSRENLTIISTIELMGTDDMGLSIKYKKTNT